MKRINSPNVGDKRKLRTPSRNGKRSKYIEVYQPDHNRARNGWVLEHLFVTEKVLGHALPKGAQIHHVDGDGTNNSNNNLVICQDQSYHKLLHMRIKAIESCGNPNFRKCLYCKIWDDPKNLAIYYSKRTNKGAQHNKCRNEYQNLKRRERLAKKI